MLVAQSCCDTQSLPTHWQSEQKFQIVNPLKSSDRLRVLCPMAKSASDLVTFNVGGKIYTVLREPTLSLHPTSLLTQLADTQDEKEIFVECLVRAGVDSSITVFVVVYFGKHVLVAETGRVCERFARQQGFQPCNNFRHCSNFSFGDSTNGLLAA